MTSRARTFALATAAATFVLLLVGGLVNPTGSSLACPDWPLCHGSAFPQMVGGVLYEHSHRLAATAVGILTIVLALVLRREGRGRLGLLAVAAVVAQGCLGGATVLLRLPPAVSIAHLALSMAFFAYLVGLAVPRRVAVSPATHRALAAAALLVYLQIVLGAIVRHTHSALACANELPGCLGQLWPAGAPYQARIHMAHRLSGVAVATVVAVAGVACARRLRGGLRLLALSLPTLVLAQIGLGAFTVLSMRALPAVELHLAVGALLLAATTILAVATRAPAKAPLLGPLLELTKPRILVLSVITAAVGLALAPGRAPIALVLALIAGTALIVGSASTLNMVLERDVDAKMTRTRRRPLPSGRLGARVALWFGVAQGLLGVPLLVFGANALTGLLGAVALLTYVVVYTPMKRRSVHALLVGAIPGAMPPLLGWTAGTGSISAGGLMLFAVIFFWQIPHFLAIALFRRDDYLAAGLKVLPNERGEDATRRAIFAGLVLQVLATLALVPLGLGGGAYLAGAAVLGAAMLAWGALGLTRRRDDAWARRLFGISVAYLPAIFALMLLS